MTSGPISDLAKQGEMAQRKFSIGIDLGTSNSVLAYSPFADQGATEVLAGD